MVVKAKIVDALLQSGMIDFAGNYAERALVCVRVFCGMMETVVFAYGCILFDERNADARKSRKYCLSVLVRRGFVESGNVNAIRIRSIGRFHRL